MTNVELASLTYEEAKAILDRGAYALLPAGATEAHGPHLPLATDVIISREGAIRAAHLLKSEGIETLLFDGHMSVMDGSIGALPRRLMVADDGQFERARQILAEAEPKGEA